ncbi:MAG: hypothetical protein JWQ25_2333, partial [Daejeonella sp.]|nr:hypothetical protein [Daejeonella sp.]
MRYCMQNAQGAVRETCLKTVRILV